MREEYEAWFIGKFGFPPMPIHSRVLDFCWAGYQAGVKNVLELKAMFSELDRVATHNYATKDAEIAELRQQLAAAHELLDDCQGWLRADLPVEGDLRRKIESFLNGQGT